MANGRTKGMYSIIAYPESSDIEEICQMILGKGGEYAYILHDQDTFDKDGKDHKAGDPKKPHWHILCGWSKGFPSWKNFKSYCDAVGAVAISKKNCLVRDPYGAYKYLTHSNGDTTDKDVLEAMEQDNETQV